MVGAISCMTVQRAIPGGKRMSIERVVTLAVVMVLLVVGWSLPAFRHPVKQPRVFLEVEAFGTSAKGAERSSVDWTEYFRSACPHMALVPTEQLADYKIHAMWTANNAGWMVHVSRRDYADVYRDSRLKSPDSLKLLRASCDAIRSDVEDWAGFGREEPPKVTPVGRYALSYHPTNYNQALLLDTKTGAVWELVQDHYTVLGRKIDYRKFNRTSVDGLYTSSDEDFAAYRAVENSGQSEAQKKERHRIDNEIRESQREAEAAKDKQ
jgi:hypothetical protein